jgi:hypothetical protein
MEENKEVVQSEPGEIELHYDYVTYLVGAMTQTAEKDGGISKREFLNKELELRNVLALNPATLETAKTGMGAKEAMEKVAGWIAGGKRDKLREAGRKIWKGENRVDEKGNLIHIAGDFDYTKQSDFITFILDVGDQPCGSYSEVGVALDHDIPIYLITPIPKTQLKQSLVLEVEASYGEFFENERQYLTWLDEKYNLKRKEEKNEK